MANGDALREEPVAGHPADDPRYRYRPLLGLLVGSTRFCVIFAIVGTGLAAASLLVYGALAVVRVIWDTVTSEAPSVEGAKHLAIDLVELTDVFLLGTVLYIVAIGLYELFVDATVPLPAWLRIDDLDQLKSKLVGVIVLLLGVTFLVAVAEWDGGSAILEFGAAIALVIAALAAHGFLSERGHGPG